MNPEIFLITRFNVPLPHKNFRWDEAWLQRRMKLFMDYCLPSVETQSCKDFHWLIVIDKNSPGWFREELRRVTRSVQNISICEMETFMGGGLKCEIEKRVIDEISCIGTCRLDTDDAISSDYVTTIRGFLLKNQTFNGIITFRNGYFTERGRVYKIDYPNNSFNCFVTRLSGNWFTCYHYNHHKIDEFANMHGFRVVKLDGIPGFLWTNHDQNISMRTGGSLRQYRVCFSTVRRHFPLPVLVVPDHALAVLFDNWYMGIKRLYRAVRRRTGFH